MTATTTVAAILTDDDGRVLVAPGEDGRWRLPGGRLADGMDDAELALSAYLRGFGVAMPNPAEAFVRTLQAEEEEGREVLNVYASACWTGRPAPGLRFADPEEFWALPMPAVQRRAVIAELAAKAPHPGIEKTLAFSGVRCYRSGGVELMLVPLTDEMAPYARSAGDGFSMITLLGEPGTAYPLDLRAPASFDPSYLAEKFKLDRRGFGYAPDELAAVLKEVADDLRAEEAMDE